MSSLYGSGKAFACFGELRQNTIVSSFAKATEDILRFMLNGRAIRTPDLIRGKDGAQGENRTRMGSPPRDFKSLVYTSSTTWALFILFFLEIFPPLALGHFSASLPRTERASRVLVRGSATWASPSFRVECTIRK